MSTARLDDFDDHEIAAALADAEASINEDARHAWPALNEDQRNNWIDTVAKARTYLLGDGSDEERPYSAVPTPVDPTPQVSEQVRDMAWDIIDSGLDADLAVDGIVGQLVDAGLLVTELPR